MQNDPTTRTAADDVAIARLEASRASQGGTFANPADQAELARLQAIPRATGNPPSRQHGRRADVRGLRTAADDAAIARLEASRASQGGTFANPADQAELARLQAIPRATGNSSMRTAADDAAIARLEASRASQGGTFANPADQAELARLQAILPTSPAAAPLPDLIGMTDRERLAALTALVKAEVDRLNAPAAGGPAPAAADSSFATIREGEPHPAASNAPERAVVGPPALEKVIDSVLELGGNELDLVHTALETELHRRRTASA